MDGHVDPALEEAAETDVVVVGAGMVGLLAAMSLAKRGMNVTVIDDVVNQKPSYKVGESFLVSPGVPRGVGFLCRAPELAGQQPIASGAVDHPIGDEPRGLRVDQRPWKRGLSPKDS
jgi:flavin-dependent dehydrogenase